MREQRRDLGPEQGHAESGASEAPYETPLGLARANFRAMGTEVTLLAPAPQIEQALRLTRDLFEEWERALSRFRPESELSRLNGRAGRPVAASPLLLRVLATALNAARATRGVFDPSLQLRMIEIGYSDSFEALAPHQPAADAGRHARAGGWRDIVVDEARGLARLPPGVGLDFGGIAKGMAVDAALDRLAEAGLTPALVNAGGDLAVRGLPEGQPSWAITAPGRVGEWVIGLERGSAATSGVARRRWTQGETPRHHLLDPRNGEPAQSALWSVTAVATTCAQAEVAAKTALILGREAGARFISEAHLAALLVAESGEWETAGAWPRAGMRPLGETVARRGDDTGREAGRDVRAEPTDGVRRDTPAGEGDEE